MLAGVFRCQAATAATTPRKETALIANTAAGPHAATSTPAIAGPTARARLTVRLPSAAAAGISSRSTSSGWIACQAGLPSA